ncbi:LacI family DNA-binding transcriptional regulator [Burkholderia sp. Ac-20353]|uniref:LacI family DNA-binding transcriptional regulator n=1 Tax=Burkholderia sp. Ac-20353 TaxID=2703894 RepID=UPI00197BC2B4|nr:LacI family DNA-binding transcriptional regulator [Burkholderia sp. Ac-20353]MBN3790957.1 LacI family transcriptional regulator [Burkholderia sp. Ac-20353]
MKKPSPTIRDVAQAADVSIATVSKYVNGTKRFSAPVEARLKTAIDTLGYRSNPLARSMITGRTRTIGLAILDIANPHFTNIVKGANRIALQHDYTLLLVDTDEDPARERPLTEALAQRVDGLIVSARAPDDASRWMLELGKPLVLLHRSAQLRIPSVGVDNALAAYMLARHLLNLGHREIAYLGFGQAGINDERIRGARTCVAEAGLTLAVYDAHAPTMRAGEHACSRVMLGPRRPQAIICYNDLIALGFMKEAAALGFRLPHDLSVTGIDNVPYGEYVTPALTTIDTQSERIGELAMQKLVDALAGHADTGHTTIDPRLIIRESTAAPG